MIEALLTVLAVLAVYAAAAGLWLYGTESGWLRRHSRHGELVREHHALTAANGWCPPSGLGVTHWTEWACPCGQTMRERTR